MPHPTPTVETIFDRMTIGDCWEWGGHTTKGYGNVTVAGQQWRVHRLVWTWLVGPIPAGMELDHLCKNKRCCNPDHLEPVAHAENVRRGESGTPQRNRTHCPQRHPYDETNTYIKGGSRVCRRCKSIAEVNRQRRKRAAQREE